MVETADELPLFIDEILAAGDGVLSAPALRRLTRAAEAAKVATALYGAWLESTLADGTDEWPLGRERHDALVGLRAFDGLDADAILALGWERLAEEHDARIAAAREIDPDADVQTVIERVKADGPTDFDGALAGYRESMLRARAHLIEHDLITVPDDERIEVIPTPEYMRSVLPFAAYFQPAAFDADANGVYVVTPSVHGDPDAMLEHNYAAISNTSIHEAYPGHHLQLDAARRHPSLTRLMTEAPEFVEGWGMYTELMMREHGFDTDARFRLVMHTDAIWRACRIILDVRMHRGELSRRRSDRRSSRRRPASSTRTPGPRSSGTRTNRPIRCRTSLGRTLLLNLRADERRRLGGAFDLKAFHDTLMRNGSLPISFHRRLLERG